jgi:hypothetical protein
MDRVAKPLIKVVGGAVSLGTGAAGRIGRLIPGVGKKDSGDTPPAERR